MALKVANGKAGVVTQAVWLSLASVRRRGDRDGGVCSMLAISLKNKTKREDLCAHIVGIERQLRGALFIPHGH